MVCDGVSKAHGVDRMSRRLRESPNFKAFLTASERDLHKAMKMQQASARKAFRVHRSSGPYRLNERVQAALGHWKKEMHDINGMIRRVEQNCGSMTAPDPHDLRVVLDEMKKLQQPGTYIHYVLEAHSEAIEKSNNVDKDKTIEMVRARRTMRQFNGRTHRGCRISGKT
jgi:hypothetical protein